MSIIEKIQFWKHKDAEQFDLGKYPGLEANTPMEPQRYPQGDMQDPGQMQHLEELGPAPLPPQGMGRGTSPLSPARAGASADPSGFLTQPAPSNFAPAQAPQDSSREFQVVNAKLDTLKAILDGINAKLDRMQPKEEVEVVPLQRRWR